MDIEEAKQRLTIPMLWARLEDRFANSPPGQQKARPPATKDEQRESNTHPAETQTRKAAQ